MTERERMDERWAEFAATPHPECTAETLGQRVVCSDFEAVCVPLDDGSITWALFVYESP